MIAAVLATLPAIDRKTQNAEDHPYNEIASSEAMQKLVIKLVRQRYPGNLWSAVHGPLCKAESTGRGYWLWTDALRDVSFQCGVEYAIRSLPEWWPILRLISPSTLADLGAMVRRIAENSLDSTLSDDQLVAVEALRRDSHDANALGSHKGRG